MSVDIVEELLQWIVQRAMSVIGRDRTIAILQAEYDAADIVVDAAERRKLGD